MGSIICGNREFFSYHIDNSEYYDFYVEGGYETKKVHDHKTLDPSTTVLNNNSIEITNNITSIKSDKIINDYGYHALDSGLLKLKFDAISNETFTNIVREHKGILYKDKVVLNRVDTNTIRFKDLENENHLNEDGSITLNGSYYQGIFGDGDDVLLDYLKNNKDFTVRLKLEPKFSEYSKSSVNEDYKDNEGTFFYLGLKSESKLVEQKFLKEKNFFKNNNDDCGGDYYPTDYIKYDSEVKYVSNNCPLGKEYIGDNEYVSGDYFNSLTNRVSYFQDNYVQGEYGEQKKGTGYVVGDYFKTEKPLKDVFQHREEDYCEKNVKTIKTDNKYLLFSRNCRDYTISKWLNSGANKVEHYVEYNEGTNENKYLTFNRSCDGLTIDKYRKYYKCFKKEYSIVKDLTNNAFSLILNRDGSITIKYLVSTCDKEKEYEIMENRTLPGLLKEGEWSDVKIMFKQNIYSYDSCGRAMSKDFKIWIYIDGFLKYISKPMPNFRFRDLKLPHRLQSGLSYNMSVGGGTLGLSNYVNLTDNMRVNSNTFYLDKHFNGVYMGRIKDFQIYPENNNIMVVNKTNYI